ncbi:MAG: TRAP transporter large permease subunit, partial [Alphaproteobacteria bacterium]|nr:TRAP transporter large permease subunit [Alphaproteobacteria bacterium]
ILGQGLGTLFAAAMIPGLLLAGIYVLYLLVVGWLWPADERAAMSKAQLLVKVVKVVVPPILLIVAVLGSIIGGIAAPTEAASVGALGSILVAAAARRLTWRVLTETVRGTLRISAMVFFILICAQAFSLAFRGLDGDELVAQLFALVPGGPTADLVFMLFLLFVLGFFMEWIEICYIVLPLFLPVFAGTDVDMVWVAILVCLVLQTSFLTPPVGWSLFFLKGVAPPEVSSRDIYVGVMPYVALQVVAIVLLFQFPEIATWLPKAIGW